MWQDKKFIIIAGLLVVLIALGATLGGIALSRQNNTDQNHLVRLVLPENAANMLQNNNLTPEERQERANEALDSYLQKLVDDGKITQDEADQFMAWWEARPDIPGLFSHLIPDTTNYFGMTHMGIGGFTFTFGWAK